MAHLTADTGDQAALRTLLRGALPDHLTGLSELLTREELQCLIDDGFTHAATLQYLKPEDLKCFATARRRALLDAFARGGPVGRL